MTLLQICIALFLTALLSLLTYGLHDMIEVEDHWRSGDWIGLGVMTIIEGICMFSLVAWVSGGLEI